MAETALVTQRPNIPAMMAYSFSRIPAQRLFLMLLATAILISMLVGLVLWSKDSDMRLLFSNISERDGGQIIQSLQTANIPYKFEGGAVYVPSDKVHETRLALASQGLPRGGNVGFELMENQKFGMTQFQEQVNYQRALEGELSRSIQSLGAVQSARVHLAIPKPSVFLREQQKPSASVLVSLYPGRALDRDQVGGVMHLVSSSVPDLPISAVSVIDQNGFLLSGGPGIKGSGGANLDEEQLAYVHQVEASYIKRVVDILEPVVGRDNVRAQITADLDFSESEATAETFKPNQNPADATVRSQQISENNNGTPASAAGVPGALTNQPTPAGTAPIAGSAAPVGTPSATANNVNIRRDATTNYEVDKTVRHTRTPTGTIRRLSAAVVVNYKKGEAPPVDPKAKGKAAAAPAPVAYSADELEKINALVKEAMGFTQTRGDSLNIANVPFSQPETVTVEEAPIWKDTNNIALLKDMGKGLLVLAVVVIILLAVVKPLFKAIKNLPDTVATPPQHMELAYEAPMQLSRYEDRLKATRELARNDPKVVASVVRDWVSKDE